MPNDGPVMTPYGVEEPVENADGSAGPPGRHLGHEFPAVSLGVVNLYRLETLSAITVITANRIHL